MGAAMISTMRSRAKGVNLILRAINCSFFALPGYCVIINTELVKKGPFKSAYTNITFDPGKVALISTEKLIFRTKRPPGLCRCPGMDTFAINIDDGKANRFFLTGKFYPAFPLLGAGNKDNRGPFPHGMTALRIARALPV
jgi:hypothetical protein